MKSEGILARLEKDIERATGQSAKQLREKTICQQRLDIEKRTGKPMRLASSSPGILDRETINRMVDKSLGIG